ncbi:hypothetical protein [[Leptolyngbya] sp. PCC 7376]|nr:hypothetical protein [[Leptolyngbya] sp. PCC 7376]
MPESSDTDQPKNHPYEFSSPSSFICAKSSLVAIAQTTHQAR